MTRWGGAVQADRDEDARVDREEVRTVTGQGGRARWLVVLAAVAVGVMAIGCSSGELEEEPARATDLPADEYRSSAFEDDFPMHFASYVENMERGGEDSSKFTEDIEPNLPMLFHNLAFAKEYNEPKGHTYAIEDIFTIARITDQSPGSCMTCKSTTVPKLFEEFGEDYWGANFNEVVRPRMEELADSGQHPDLGEYGHVSIGCSDCHDPQTMQLRISRPSFSRAMERQGVDLSEATKNDMRSYVCGQCHVEYYFAAENKEVVFPWDYGLRAEDMYEYFEETAVELGFAGDWVHGVSGATMLKAQHPEFELWSYGTHGEAGVACADCHMPYQRVDGRKITQHVWGSPIETAEQSCRTCHADRNAQQLTQRVRDIQERHLQAMEETQEVSIDAHYYVNRMITAGVDQERIEEAQHYVRKGQWFWDIIAAENSDGFHNANGAMDALRVSAEASYEAIRIATEELVRADVDLVELREEIEKVKTAVYAEEDAFEKHTHAVNDYFPPQGG
jgi:nitrite reductase (cytochrome c-552)